MKHPKVSLAEYKSGDETNMLKCPVCNKVISDFDQIIHDFDDEGSGPCEHVMLTYVDILSGEFVYIGAGAAHIAKEILVQYNHAEAEDEAEGEGVGEGIDVSIDDLMDMYADEKEGYVVIGMPDNQSYAVTNPKYCQALINAATN